MAFVFGAAQSTTDNELAGLFGGSTQSISCGKRRRTDSENEHKKKSTKSRANNDDDDDDDEGGAGFNWMGAGFGKGAGQVSSIAIPPKLQIPKRKATGDTSMQVDPDAEPSMNHNQRRFLIKKDKIANTPITACSLVEVSNIPVKCKKKHVLSALQQFGPITRVTLTSRVNATGQTVPAALVYFTSINGAHASVSAEDVIVNGAKVHMTIQDQNDASNDVGTSTSSSTTAATTIQTNKSALVMVSNLPSGITDSMIRRQFEKCGTIDALKMDEIKSKKQKQQQNPKDLKVIAYLLFTSADSADNALKLHRSKFSQNDAPIRVSLSSSFRQIQRMLLEKTKIEDAKPKPRLVTPPPASLPSTTLTTTTLSKKNPTTPIPTTTPMTTAATAAATGATVNTTNTITNPSTTLNSNKEDNKGPAKKKSTKSKPKKTKKTITTATTMNSDTNKKEEEDPVARARRVAKSFHMVKPSHLEKTKTELKQKTSQKHKQEKSSTTDTLDTPATTKHKPDKKEKVKKKEKHSKKDKTSKKDKK